VLGVVAGVVLEVDVVGGAVVAVEDCVVVVVVAGAVALTVGVDGVVIAGVLAWWQSFRASSETVEAPWIRLLRRVTLTEGGRPFTASLSPDDALAAPAQLPEASAAETWLSWLERVLD
jgi:hypothetical protein